jgi:alpha-glucosidase
MFTRNLKFYLLTLLAILLASATEIFAIDNLLTKSPDGKVEFKIFTTNGQLNYAVSFMGKPVIETSPMNMLVDGSNLSSSVRLGEVENYKINEQYATRGVHSMARNNCNGTRIAIASKTSYFVDVRVFNDGIAFRFTIPGSGDRVPDEATVFRIPSASSIWYHEFYYHYEGQHRKRNISELQKGEWAAPPITFKLPSGYYASITEANLVNYAGMALQADGKGGLVTRLGHVQPSSYPFAHDYKLEDALRLGRPAVISGPITTPWRAIIIGKDLNTMVNTDLVTNLCAPPDKTFFPGGMNTDWVKPGRSVWTWLDGGDRTLAGMKEFSKLAGELGYEYNTVDAFWSRWTDAQIKELVDTSANYSVKVWLWQHGRNVRDKAERRAFFKRCHDLGVVGVKLDAFSNESKEFIDLYQECLRDAAEFKLMVNFHGNNKPSGESRTWPNEMTREGIRGLEYGRSQDAWAVHNTTLPFTRLLAGHGDYTPLVFSERKLETTWAHQIATAIIFTSPVLVFGGNPKTFLANPALAVLKNIKGTWDETVVLPVSEIGEIAAFARRSGDNWFLAVLNGNQQKNFQMPLQFLGDGWYEATVISDGADPASLRRNTAFTRSTDALPVNMGKAGGYVVQFIKVRGK